MGKGVVGMQTAERGGPVGPKAVLHQASSQPAPKGQCIQESVSQKGVGEATAGKVLGPAVAAAIRPVAACTGDVPS